MAEPHSTNCQSADDWRAERLKTASVLPFFLRAWWLRDFALSADIDFHVDVTVTGPVWSLYSDPMSDTGSLDFADET